jgi:hypothetical protein
MVWPEALTTGFMYRCFALTPPSQATREPSSIRSTQASAGVMSEPFQSKPQDKDGVFWRLYLPRSFSNPFAAHGPQYDRLANRLSEGLSEEKPQPTWLRRILSRLFPLFIVFTHVLVAILAFGAGSLHRAPPEARHDGRHSLVGVATRVPLPLIKKKFAEKSDFLQEPPHGEGSGNISEPIWDDLLPS